MRHFLLLLPPPRTTGSRLFVCLTFLTLFMGQCQSQFRPPQVEITDSDTVGYRFLQQDDNEIINAAYLEPFFQKLYEQRIGGGKKISVVHIGDSHILGNYLTREVRARLQRAFGDAGRGLIFPYKLAGSSGSPRDYLVESKSKWHGSNCQRNSNTETPVGVSGFTLETANLNAEITFRLRDTATSETRLFTKLTVFQHKTALEYDMEVYDEVSNQKAQPFLEDQYARSFYFDRPVGQATIKAKKLTNQQKRLTLDGISLENELSGVTYHSIGVNSARFQDFAHAKYFARQVAELQPDLIILSFGTNEAQAKIESAYLRSTITDLIKKLLEHSPNALIMLTTPADSYLRGKGLNPNMTDVSAVIRKLSRDNGYAVWDLFKHSGGENSAQLWKSNGLMSHDSVHYSKIGYAAQGKLLYQALIKGYNGYAAQKP